MKWYICAGVALAMFVIGLGIGKWGCKGAAEFIYGQHSIMVIDEQTRGETARRLSELENRNEFLEGVNDSLNADLIATVKTTMELKATIAEYETEELTPGRYSWRWRERGGGEGWFDRATEKVDMSFDPWTIGLDVEISRLPDGRVLALARVDTNEISLTETEFYANDPCGRSFFNRIRFGGEVGGADIVGSLKPIGEINAGFTIIDKRDVTPMFAYEVAPGFRAVKFGVTVNPF